MASIEIEKIKRISEEQKIINKLLRISLKDLPLEQMLDKIFSILTSISWIALEAKGGIWLADSKAKFLYLKSSHDLPSLLLKNCAKIPFGKCLCGKAAASGKVEFADHINRHHKIKYSGMDSHGHYCVPIMSKKRVLGIINFYLQTGHAYNQEEVDFLIAVSDILASILKCHENKEALRKSEARWTSMVKNAPNIIAIINKKGLIQFINRPAKNIAPKGIINLSIYKLINPEFHAIAKQSIASVFSTGNTSRYEAIGQDANKQDAWYDVRVSPITNGKQISAVTLFITDITKRKTAETEIRRLSEFNERILNNAPVSIVVLNKQGKIISGNWMAKKLMEKRNQKLINRKLIDTNEIKKNPYLLEKYKTLFEKGEAFYYHNLSYAPNDMTEKKYLNLIVVPLFDKNHKVEGAISMALDNTEAMMTKKKLEELNRSLEQKVILRTRELDNINKKLNQAISLKSKFIADASHELRTPLTVIQGNLDLAVREAQKKHREVPETYGLIIQEVERMAYVLSDLTMLTNIDSQSEQLLHEEINLGKLIKAVGQSLRILADQKKIALIYNKGAKNISVLGDEAKLEKLFLNIVNNAIKYTEPKGKIKLWIENDKREIRIYIEDNGIGIPEEDLPFIFERFYRVDKARSRHEGGTGLGLSICKWIAETHGGHINVISEINKGTTFIVRLPLDYKKEPLPIKLF